MPTKKKIASPVKKILAKKSKTDKKSDKDRDFLIVGIGASAGGLETLNAFFSIMPIDCNMAFVAIQHLSPNHRSIMASLVDRHTQMTVMQIEDGTMLEPNHIYLNPPGKNVAIFNQRLHLLDMVETVTINMPIDFFFRSLSEDRAEKAVGIILSGTASDGTLGIRAIKGEGGMVMVQKPETAKYDGMPKSAIETGIVDFILPVEKMPEALVNYSKHPFLESANKFKVTDRAVKNQMQKIFAMIRSATGHDFLHYKQNTIARRIERRLAVHHITALSDYILYLQTNPAEIDRLFKDMIIGVTRFFRDPEAFDLLAQQVLPELLSKKDPDATIRFWVTGCSTGEEAYSLAMILSEVLDKRKKHFNVQIFATDIDEGALGTARKGIYPESIGADVSPERLKRFFKKTPGGFKVIKQLRDMVVFSLQNVVKDPPFSRLDMVSCRNLMIYMDNVLQKKIIPLFHYTLFPGAILFLGPSESIGENADLFGTINSKWKIFERKKDLEGAVVAYHAGNNYNARQGAESKEKENLLPKSSLNEMAERAILYEYAPAGVLIDDKFEIQHFVGNTDRYLATPTGKPIFNILDMAREGIKHPLSVALHKMVRNKKEAFLKNIQVHNKDTFCVVDIFVKQMTERGVPLGFFLVIFKDKTPAKAANKKKTGALKAKEEDAALHTLEQELQSTREYLQSTIEELETSNEELRSANEELQSLNEEMQSTNEELETSKEEIQSTNEELCTVNTELQDKVDEFSRVNGDMDNLLAATEIASIFLDADFCIKRYTPAAAKIVSLIQTDIGRPISDLKTRFSHIDLADMAENVLKDLNPMETEVKSNDFIWYAIKVIPYRTTDNVIDGVVVTFIDVHKIKQAEKIRRLATVLQDSNDAVMVMDLKGNILSWNKGAQKMYGWSETEALRMNFSLVMTEDRKNEMIPIIKKIKRNGSIASFQTQRKTKDGIVLNVWMTVSSLKDARGDTTEVAITERNLEWSAEKK